MAILFYFIFLFLFQSLCQKSADKKSTNIYLSKKIFFFFFINLPNSFYLIKTRIFVCEFYLEFILESKAIDYKENVIIAAKGINYNWLRWYMFIPSRLWFRTRLCQCQLQKQLNSNYSNRQELHFAFYSYEKLYLSNDIH